MCAARSLEPQDGAGGARVDSMKNWRELKTTIPLSIAQDLLFSTMIPFKIVAVSGQTVLPSTRPLLEAFLEISGREAPQLLNGCGLDRLDVLETCPSEDVLHLGNWETSKNRMALNLVSRADAG